jgi:hypothetical protein
MSWRNGLVCLLAVLPLWGCGTEEPAPELPLLESHEFQDLLGRSRAEEYRVFEVFAPLLVQGVLKELPMRMSELAGNRPAVAGLVARVSTEPPPIALEELPGATPIYQLPQHLQALANAAFPGLTPEQRELMRGQMAELAVEATPETLKRAVESEGETIATFRGYAPPAAWLHAGQRPKDLYGWFRRMQRRPFSKTSEWDRRVAAYLGGEGVEWVDGNSPADILVQRVLRRVLDYEDMFWAVIVVLRYGPPTRFEGPYAKMIEETRAGIVELAADRIKREWSKIMLALDQYLLWEYDREAEAHEALSQTRGPPASPVQDRAGPTIELIQPAPSRGFRMTTGASRVDVEVRVDDPSGVKTVEINGQPVTKAAAGTYKQGLDMPDGELAIEIRAEDNLGNARTYSAGLTRSEGQAVLKSARRGRDFALLIGCEAYEDWAPLKNPVADATAVRDVLRDTYGFETELLTNPTKADLQRKIREYVAQSFAPDDQLFIFYAGHGHYDEPPLDLGYLVLKDSKQQDELRETYIRHDSLLVLIDRIPCPHILVVLDACFGGAAFEARMGRGTRGGNDVMADISIDEMVKRKMPLRTRKLITSGGTEYVWDGPARQHSPFASRLLGALRELDGHTTGLLTYPRLLGAVELGKPGAFGGSLGGDDPGSDFLFIKRGK